MVSFAIVEGNPGALTFLMEAYDKNLFLAERGFQRMQNAGITGSRLYMLWNDCCGRNTEMAMDIMQNKAIDIILHHIDGGEGRGIPIGNQIEALSVAVSALQTQEEQA